MTIAALCEVLLAFRETCDTTWLKSRRMISQATGIAAAGGRALFRRGRIPVS